VFEDLIKEDKIDLQIVEAKLSVLELEPGDIVVFQIGQNLPQHILEKIRQHLNTKIPNHTILVLNADVEMTILREKKENS
jgi:hypothetical protein